MKKIVLFHSKPGLGKSTLAKSVAEQLNHMGVSAASFSIGEHLRAISDGHLASQYSSELMAKNKTLSRHAHVSDPKIIHGVVAEYLQQVTADIVLIDGHPRYVAMIPDYEETLRSSGWQTELVVIIRGSDALAQQRIEKRARVADGLTEDPAWRLKDYAETMAPVLEWLCSHYPTLYVDAAMPLEQKTAQVIERCITT